MKTTEKLKIRCPIHGRIDLSLGQHVFDSDPMQLMGFIKQLGGAYMILRGAVHSRLAHMAGTAHIALERAIKLWRDGILSWREVILVFLAALVHDVGHRSFSHFMEPLYGDHDERGIQLILTELAPFIEMCDADPEEVAQICRRTHPLSDLIFPNPLGADKLDYLARDAYYALGNREKLDDLYTHFIGFDHKNGLYLLNEGVLLAFKTIVLSWYMFSDVYEHPNPRVFQRYLQANLSLTMRKSRTVKEALFKEGEDAVIGAIGEWCKRPANRGDECAERHRRIKLRQHPKKTLILSATPRPVPANQDEELLAKLECDPSLPAKTEDWSISKIDTVEREIAEIIGAAPHQVTLAIAPPGRRCEVPEVKVKIDGGICLIGDVMPSLHTMAAGVRESYHSVIIGVDEPLRHLVASDLGLQIALRDHLQAV